MPTRDEIYETVKETVVDALGLDDDEVSPESTLFGDLDAESIDLLDITFKLEQEFSIKIPRAELFPAPGDLGEDADSLVQDGKLTDEGVTKLRGVLGHADLDEFAADPRVEKFQDLYTVDMIVNYVDSRLNS